MSNCGGTPSLYCDCKQGTLWDTLECPFCEGEASSVQGQFRTPSIYSWESKQWVSLLQRVSLQLCSCAWSLVYCFVHSLKQPRCNLFLEVQVVMDTWQLQCINTDMTTTKMLQYYTSTLSMCPHNHVFLPSQNWPDCRFFLQKELCNNSGSNLSSERVRYFADTCYQKSLG